MVIGFIGFLFYTHEIKIKKSGYFKLIRVVNYVLLILGVNVKDLLRFSVKKFSVAARSQENGDDILLYLPPTGITILQNFESKQYTVHLCFGIHSFTIQNWYFLVFAKLTSFHSDSSLAVVREVNQQAEYYEQVLQASCSVTFDVFRFSFFYPHSN